MKSVNEIRIRQWRVHSLYTQDATSTTNIQFQDAILKCKYMYRANPSGTYLSFIAAKIYFLKKGKSDWEKRLSWPLDKPIDRATVHQTENQCENMSVTTSG